MIQPSLRQRLYWLEQEYKTIQRVLTHHQLGFVSLTSEVEVLREALEAMFPESADLSLLEGKIRDRVKQKLDQLLPESAEAKESGVKAPGAEEDGGKE